MNLAAIDLFAPIFSTSEMERLCRADAVTLDNWDRYKHLPAERVGGRRLYSGVGAISADLMIMMQKSFGIRPEVAAEVLRTSLPEYLDNFASKDQAEISQGADWNRLVDARGDAQFGLVRDADGSLRAIEREDSPLDEVMIVLPVRLVARSVLAKIKLWLEQEND